MSIVRYTLVADGPRDRCLLPVIDWVMARVDAVAAGGFSGYFADLRALINPPVGLQARVLESMRKFPCEVLFVHRDSEGQPADHRRQEIDAALVGSGVLYYVPIIPIRMTEAWLLTDERAIRTAASNPNGTSALPLPPIHRLEATPDPKQVLHNCLLAAQNLGRRRRRQFERRLGKAVFRVAELTESFEQLRELSAFASFEHDVRSVVGDVVAAN